MLLVHYAFDILDHHYGVVHHYTYGEYQAEQGEDIERESEYEHESECSNQRYGHGYKGNKRGSPALQRQEHDKYNQRESFEERLVHFMD